MITCMFENGDKGLLRHVCIDALVLSGDKILLVKRVEDKFLEGGKWGLIGGFAERNEDLQGALRREVFEETGYRVDNIELLTIRHNPDRPHEDRQNIAFVFLCQAGKKEGNPDDESTAQGWFLFSEIPNPEQIAFDHYKNIELYLKYKKENLTLPLFEDRL